MRLFFFFTFRILLTVVIKNSLQSNFISAQAKHCPQRPQGWECIYHWKEHHQSWRFRIQHSHPESKRSSANFLRLSTICCSGDFSKRKLHRSKCRSLGNGCFLVFYNNSFPSIQRWYGVCDKKEDSERTVQHAKISL